MTSLDVMVNPKAFVYVVLFMTVILGVSLLIATSKILRKRPKELLIDTK